MANFDPRGMVGRINVEDHQTLLHTTSVSSCLMVSEKKIFEGSSATVGDHYSLLHTKYISCGPHGFREKDFLGFSHFKSMGANDPWDTAISDPRGMVGRIYVGDHKTSLHT